MVRLIQRASWGLSLAVLSLSLSVLAAPELPGLRVAGSGSCPSSRGVIAELRELVPRGQEGAFSDGVEVSLTEEGQRYRVQVVASEKSAEKSYLDVAEDCDKRARVAAVFVFLTVLPPQLRGEDRSERDLEEPGVEPVAPPEEPAPPLPRRHWVHLELGGLLETAPARGSASAVTSPGVELRTVVGGGTIAPFFGFGYSPPADLVVPELRARLRRVPASVGVRWRIPFEGFWVGLDGSVQGQLQSVTATSPLHANEEAVLRWGTRWGLTMGPSWSVVAPFAGVHATLLFDRRELVLLPRGAVGELPRLWLGASVGLALGL